MRAQRDDKAIRRVPPVPVKPSPSPSPKATPEEIRAEEV